MKSKLILVLVAILFSASPAFPQLFQEVTSTGLPDLSMGELEWGDFDQDGDLDALCMGYGNSSAPLSAVYRNNGNNTFSLFTGASLTGLYYGSCGWGDYNNDNYLDILITGRNASGIRYTQIYRNNNGLSFTLQTGINLLAMDYSSVDWGDYDNDGDLDILISGQDVGAMMNSLVYRNNGNNTFSLETGISLRGVSRGSTDWIDVNYDGLLDIFITGFDQASTSICALYRNDGGGSFTEINGLPFTGVYFSDASWGDYDSDGDPDLLLTGYSTQLASQITRLYKTGYSFSFTDPGISAFTDMYVGSGDWGDYDNDGDLDVILSGYTGSGGLTEVFRNDGGGNFVKYSGTSFPNVYYSSVQWGDFDGDRDLDILVDGYTGSSRATRLYRNTSSVANTPPTAPTGLEFSMNSEGMHFTWNQSDDNESSNWHLTYNLRIGTSPGASDVMSSSSDVTSGKLFLAEAGSLGRNYHFTISDLPAGNYYWSVQAVDHGYLASPFSEEQHLELTFTRASIEYGGDGIPYLGDYDGDGDLDILDGNGSGTTIYRNDVSGGGDFVDIGVDLSGNYGSDALYGWGDFDNDGDLDFVFSGLDSTVLYRNNAGNFVNVEAGLQGVWMGDMDLGDYDNDGDLDIFLYGNHEFSDDGEPIGILYRNDGNFVFSNSGIDIEEARRGSVSLGDYNNDGYIDIVTCGHDLSENIFTSILRNNAGISFTNINAGIEGGRYGGVAWADYDNDGDLDFYFAGDIYTGSAPAKVFQNMGNETFADIEANFPQGSWSYNSTVQWGDYDNDGDQDILPNYGTEIFQNEGNNVFILKEIGIEISTAAWGDLDNDGDLDIVTAEAIYLNSTQAGNNPPAIPGNIHVEIAGNQATLYWDPSSDDHTPSQGLTYNVRVGSSPGASDILGPMTDLSGLNKAIPDMGNAMTNTFKIIRDLPLGTYYWSVQAVDQSYLCSAFSVEGSFEIFPMYTKVLDDYFSKERISWADYDNDGDLDIMEDAYNGVYIHKNVGNDNFQSDLIIASEYYSDVAWYDYDNDGDLDIISADSIFRNDLNDQFVYVGTAPNVPFAEGSRGDYDFDGDIDFLKGMTIYRNDGNFSFSEIQLTLGSGETGDCFWFDYDNDNDMDLVFMYGTYDNLHTEIYRNDGNDVFTDIQANITGIAIYYGTVTFADYNSDGLLDIYLGGYDNEFFNNLSLIYRNDGNDSFTLLDANIRGYHSQEVFWGDYNFDGFMDLVISGYNNGRYRNLLYQNNNDDSFTELGIEDIIPQMSIFQSGDYDGDGDLDKITSNGIYRNNTNQPYPDPGGLSGLGHDLKGLDCLLSWDGSDDAFGKGYSYNIRIGTTADGFDIKAPNLLPGFGNVPSDTTFLIRDLDPDIYYWSVQAVNQVQAKGPWAPEQTFIITRVSPDFDYDTVCYAYPTTFTDLSVTTDTIVRWQWDFGDGTGSTAQHPVHTFPAADTFLVSLWAFTQSGDSTERVHPVIVRAAPEAIFMVDPVCKDQPSVLQNFSMTTGITVASWEWDFGNGETSNIQGTVEKTYVSSATATLTIVAENGCWDSDVQNVVIAPYPDATVALISGYSNEFCDGDSTLMVVSNQPGYNYQWKLNDANIFAANDTFLYVNGPTGEYKIEVENPLASCISEDSMDITVYPTPTSPVISYSTDPGALCDGEPLTLSIPNTPGYTFDWRRDGGTLGVNSYQVNPTESGDYTVLISNSDNCTAESGSAVTVNFLDLPTPPSISIQGNSNFCDGDSVILTVPDNPSLVYQWIRDSQILTGETSIRLVARQEGVYEIEVRDGNNCTESGAETVDVIVRERPGAPSILVSGSTSLCDGDTVKLSVPYDPDYTYEWKRDGGLTGGSANEYQPTVDGNYSVTITNIVDCPVDAQNPVAIDFLANPDQPSIIVGNTEICEGDGVLMRVTEVPGLTYAWFRDNFLQLEGAQNSYTATESGNFTVEVTNNDNCMSPGTESVDVTVMKLPVVPVISIEGETTLCEGETVILSVPHTPGYEYLWKRDGGGTGIDTTLIYPTESGSYNVSITNHGYCPVEAESPVAVVFRARPAVPPISYPEDTILCEGESIVLRTSEVAGQQYQWYDEEELLFGEESSSLTVSSSGYYSVIVSNDILCQTASDKVVTITVNPLPATGTIEIEGDTEFCGTDSVRLWLTEWTGHSYEWRRNTNLLNHSSSELYVSNSGTYTATLVNEYECRTQASNSVEVQALDFPVKPVITGTSETVFCEGELVSFSFDNLGTNEACIWSWNGMLYADSIEKIQVSENGTYILEIINEVGCKSPPSSPKTLTFYASPETPLLSIGTDTLVAVCPDDLNQISITNYNAANNYHWYYNTVGFSPDDPSVVSGTLEAGTYQAQADIAGCESDMVKFDLEWKEAPEKPTIGVYGGPAVYYLYCDQQDADFYQWYYNGEIIPGANEDHYVANQDLGEYQLEISETDKECSILSDVIHVPDVSTGWDENEIGQLAVYPNPNQGEFMLEFRNDYTGKTWLKMISVDGRTHIHRQFSKQTGILSERISVELLPGIYILELQTEERSWYERVVVK